LPPSHTSNYLEKIGQLKAKVKAKAKAKIYFVINYTGRN